MINAIKKNIPFTLTALTMFAMVYYNNFDYVNVIFVFYTIIIIIGIVVALFVYLFSALLHSDDFVENWKSEENNEFEKVIGKSIELNKKFSGFGFWANSIKTAITIALMLLCGFEFLVVFYILTTIMVIHCVRVSANAASRHIDQ